MVPKIDVLDCGECYSHTRGTDDESRESKGPVTCRCIREGHEDRANDDQDVASNEYPLNTKQFVK
jgi:hypothetical protein